MCLPAYPCLFFDFSNCTITKILTLQIEFRVENIRKDNFEDNNLVYNNFDILH